MVVADDVDQDIFPQEGEGIGSESDAWSTRLPAVARRQNWQVHIRWVRGVG
jgi:hypothetical protein